jgi:hypothetical protein
VHDDIAGHASVPVKGKTKDTGQSTVGESVGDLSSPWIGWRLWWIIADDQGEIGGRDQSVASKGGTVSRRDLANHQRQAQGKEQEGEGQTDPDRRFAACTRDLPDLHLLLLLSFIPGDVLSVSIRPLAGHVYPAQ